MNNFQYKDMTDEAWNDLYNRTMKKFNKIARPERVLLTSQTISFVKGEAPIFDLQFPVKGARLLSDEEYAEYLLGFGAKTPSISSTNLTQLLWVSDDNKSVLWNKRGWNTYVHSRRVKEVEDAYSGDLTKEEFARLEQRQRDYKDKVTKIAMDFLTEYLSAVTTSKVSTISKSYLDKNLFVNIDKWSTVTLSSAINASINNNKKLTNSNFATLLTPYLFGKMLRRLRYNTIVFS